MCTVQIVHCSINLSFGHETHASSEESRDSLTSVLTFATNSYHVHSVMVIACLA
jgi:hypothetical protein